MLISHWRMSTILLLKNDWYIYFLLPEAARKKYLNYFNNLTRAFGRLLQTVSATFLERKSIRILTTNIKEGLAISAKVILLKYIQLLTMPLIPLRPTKPNWWIDQSACNSLSWYSNYLNLIKLLDVEELFALICLCHAWVFCSLVMLYGSTYACIPRTQVIVPLPIPCAFIFSIAASVLCYVLLISSFLS